MGKMKTTESKYDNEKKGFILKALQDASATMRGLVTDGGINISNTPQKDLQKKVLIKALYDQIKENNVNNLTQEELDQFVTKACDEAKFTDGFPINIHMLCVFLVNLISVKLMRNILVSKDNLQTYMKNKK